MDLLFFVAMFLIGFSVGLLIWDAAVTQNICKNPAGIFQYHRAYVLCSFQTLEYLQL